MSDSPPEFSGTLNSNPDIYPDSWSAAWSSSPGPRTFREYFLLFSKGLGMGTADIIPGVSGGTIAFITGIYTSLLTAISSINGKVLWQVFRLRFKEALSELHLRFLLTLVLGIAVAVISTARLMHFLLSKHPLPTWSLFFGLIAASILIVGRSIHHRSSSLSALLLGIFSAYGITGLIPLHTPETAGFIFFSGMLAICAMILPGLSGAFILLILGKYAFITAALRNPFLPENFEIIAIFLSGCIIGILGFSRILRYSLERWRDFTLALLTGLMIGAMRKVWPWKIVLESEVIRGKEYVLREENVLPLLDSGLAVALLLMVIGFAIVLFLEHFVSNSVNDS